MLSPHSLVADLLADSPQVAPLLIELRVDCIGCSLNRFCTLEDLCRYYELDLETVFNKIQALRR